MIRDSVLKTKIKIGLSFFLNFSNTRVIRYDWTTNIITTSSFTDLPGLFLYFFLSVGLSPLTGISRSDTNRQSPPMSRVELPQWTKWGHAQGSRLHEYLHKSPDLPLESRQCENQLRVRHSRSKMVGTTDGVFECHFGNLPLPQLRKPTLGC